MDDIQEDNSGSEVKNLSEYNSLLREARETSTETARKYIPRLYKALVEGEKLDPKDAGDKIKHDLVDVLSKATINKYLPDEGKHKEQDHSKSVKPLSRIVLQQSSSGSSRQAPEPEPMPANPNPIPRYIEPQPEPENNIVIIEMSHGQCKFFTDRFREWLKENEREHKEKGMVYIIEYDVKTKDINIDVDKRKPN